MSNILLYFFFHRGQEIGAVEGSRIMRGLRGLATKSTNSRKGWNLSQIVTMGFYLTCNFSFSEFNGGVPVLIRLWVFQFERNQWLSFNCHTM